MPACAIFAPFSLVSVLTLAINSARAELWSFASSDYNYNCTGEKWIKHKVHILKPHNFTQVVNAFPIVDAVSIQSKLLQTTEPAFNITNDLDGIA